MFGVIYCIYISISDSLQFFAICNEISEHL